MVGNETYHSLPFTHQAFDNQRERKKKKNMTELMEDK